MTALLLLAWQSTGLADILGTLTGLLHELGIIVVAVCAAYAAYKGHQNAQAIKANTDMTEAQGVLSKERDEATQLAARNATLMAKSATIAAQDVREAVLQTTSAVRENTDLTLEAREHAAAAAGKVSNLRDPDVVASLAAALTAAQAAAQPLDASGEPIERRRG